LHFKLIFASAPNPATLNITKNIPSSQEKKRIFSLEQLVKISDYRTFAFCGFPIAKFRRNQNCVFETLSRLPKKDNFFTSAAVKARQIFDEF
jgi:hypothetical protein